jgi:hypothetical protein
MENAEAIGPKVPAVRGNAVLANHQILFEIGISPVKWHL